MSQEKMLRALNLLCKWRNVLAGWQLGTQALGDPECDAVRDHREQTLIMRAEVSALVGLLVKKGVFTIEEFQDQLLEEAQAYSEMYAAKFPGVTATDFGVKYDARVATQTMRGWKP